MKSQTGARYVRKQKQELREKETVCICHVKRESELTRIKPGVVRRKRNTDNY